MRWCRQQRVIVVALVVQSNIGLVFEATGCMGVTRSRQLLSRGEGEQVDWRDAGALHEAFSTCSDKHLGDLVNRSLTILANAIRVFGSDAVYASFNGGKDAVVILHLLRAARHAQNRAAKLHLVYFDTTDDFDEVRDFVHDTCAALDTEFYVESVERDVGFVAGLTNIVDRTAPRALAFVLGTRQGDPNCGEQQQFEPSSPWMPAFMRVNPILHWTYGDVWTFLRYFDLPYCSLYDQGYTSLGSKSTTLRNPALCVEAGVYRPAYELEDWALERAGRAESPKRKKPQHST
ncbi:hypothetical protein CTAYLR_006498 [Chrysophaeum taylorii]|uniref:FAD synthase n=1 Tax=Chrysophaeum taylorii TaxID=2483200 RepID=A0AAD7ULC0_9STRA|nr:hypothetical protein CTAYLR_006498 [Chrysophaeum taylorii]